MFSLTKHTAVYVYRQCMCTGFRIHLSYLEVVIFVFFQTDDQNWNYHSHQRTWRLVLRKQQRPQQAVARDLTTKIGFYCTKFNLVLLLNEPYLSHSRQTFFVCKTLQWQLWPCLLCLSLLVPTGMTSYSKALTFLPESFPEPFLLQFTPSYIHYRQRLFLHL